MVLFFQLCLTLSIMLFTLEIPQENDIYSADGEHQSIFLTISFISINIFTSLTTLANAVLFSKAIEGSTFSRALLLGLSACVSALGILFVDGIGNRIYEKDATLKDYETITPYQKDINTNVIQLRSSHEQFVEGYTSVHKDPFFKPNLVVDTRPTF